MPVCCVTIERTDAIAGRVDQLLGSKVGLMVLIEGLLARGCVSPLMLALAAHGSGNIMWKRLDNSTADTACGMVKW